MSKPSAMTGSPEARSSLALIGNTPIVRLDTIGRGVEPQLLAKLAPQVQVVLLAHGRMIPIDDGPADHAHMRSGAPEGAACDVTGAPAAAGAIGLSAYQAEAVAAVHRPRARRLEGDLGLLAAARADRVVHLPRATVVGTTVAARAAGAV